MPSKGKTAKLKLKEPSHRPKPKWTIEDLLEVAEGIYRETGHYPSFGEVQTGIEAGEIHPECYLNRGRRGDKR